MQFLLQTGSVCWCQPVFSFSSTCIAYQPLSFQLVTQSLVSVSIIGTHDDMTDESLSSTVYQEMSQWFGDKQTADWKLLKVYRVPFAQPNQVKQGLSPTVCHSPIHLEKKCCHFIVKHRIMLNGAICPSPAHT